MQIKKAHDTTSLQKNEVVKIMDNYKKFIAAGHIAIPEQPSSEKRVRIKRTLAKNLLKRVDVYAKMPGIHSIY
ncbi:MAG: hypothetical protein HKL80_06380 [Acidimicrobiales bacterium]|nr:hypothetical protein [Acidimicrobiales bacterium]